MTPHCQPLRKRYCTRCAKECVQFLIAAFDLICFLRPLPLCGGVSEVRLLGKRIARVKCTQSCTAAGTKAPPCGLPINRSAERCRPAARGAAPPRMPLRCNKNTGMLQVSYKSAKAVDGRECRV